jgi:hypothetical protein
MFNRIRTKEVFGYDLDLTKRRRTKVEIASTNDVNKKDLTVIDNCPLCNIERQIKLRQSRKNAPCSKCFHNSPEMVLAKQNQTKIKSEETKQKMKENHWSKNGGVSAFKGKQHTEEAKAILKKKTKDYYDSKEYDEYKGRYIKGSCTQRNIPLEDFNGFSAPEGTRIRQSAKGKAWTYDVLAKANFTCDKCKQRGGKLQAHHLNSFNSFPDQRFDTNNGVCLCESCHDLFHSKYGRGNNTADQYSDFSKISSI